MWYDCITCYNRTASFFSEVFQIDKNGKRWQQWDRTDAPTNFHPGKDEWQLRQSSKKWYPFLFNHRIMEILKITGNHEKCKVSFSVCSGHYQPCFSCMLFSVIFLFCSCFLFFFLDFVYLSLFVDRMTLCLFLYFDFDCRFGFVCLPFNRVIICNYICLCCLTICIMGYWMILACEIFIRPLNFWKKKVLNLSKRKMWKGLKKLHLK